MVSALRAVERKSVKDQIVGQLMNLITSGAVPPGNCLPPANKLAQQLGVSCIALREALSFLAAQGLVDVRHGRGTFVNPPELWNINDPLLLLAKGGNAALHELLEVREYLEPHLAALAAERATPEDLRLLEETIKMGDTVDESVKIDIAFHLAVAKASHNEVLVIMLHSVNELMQEIRRESFVALPHTIEQAFRRHSSILRKIEQRDVQGAYEAMARHLKEARKNHLTALEMLRKESRYPLGVADGS